MTTAKITVESQRHTKQRQAPVEELLRAQPWVIISHSLHEITLSGGLADELRQARRQRLQQHTDVRSAVGLQLLGCDGVQRGVLRDAVGRTVGAKVGLVRRG